jgi:hypothetical protein
MIRYDEPFMASDRDPIEALAATRAKFGPGPRRLKLRLLERIASAPPDRPRDVTACRDALLFIMAYPDDAAVRRAADAALAAIDEIVAGDDRLAGRLADSGIPGTVVEAPFSVDLARWLLRRFPGDVEIAFDEGSAGPGLDELLFACTPTAQRDGLLADGLTTEGWLRMAAGEQGEELAWLLDALDALGAPPELVDRAFESSEVKLRWRVAETPGGFARRRLFAQSGGIERFDDLEGLLRRPLPDTRPLPQREARSLIETARVTLASLQRETDPVTYANPREVTRFELERGVEVVLYGMLPGRRLPIESFFGYLAARNGVPIAYGGGWVFLDRCEIGINIFEQFRGGESAFIFGQILRVYHRHYDTRRFTVDPFQFGADNRDAILSGAFWFYYRFGFRPVDAKLAALAEEEWARIRADREYRTPPRTLQRFASGKLALELDPDTPAVPDVVSIGLAVTWATGERFGSDAAAAERWATNRVTRALGRPAAERDALRRLAPVAALIDDLGRWSAADRRALAALMRAKDGPRERDYVRKMQAHRRFRDALVEITAGR